MRTALVTGASSGIGAAVARRLRGDGWRLVGLARRRPREVDVALSVDVADQRQVSEAVAGVGPLQLVVHAAAVTGPIAPLADSDPEAWAETIQADLLGTYHVLRATLPLLQGGGVFVHVTSGAAANAKPWWSAYSAAKAGAEHLVRHAAREVDGTAVAVCALDPGITDTPMQAEIRLSSFPGQERFVRVHEEGSDNTPDAVADAVVVLVGRPAAEINGGTFRVGEVSNRS